MIKKILVFTCWFYFSLSPADAQQIFATLDGKIAITLKYGDSLLVATSTKMIARLNYDNAEIKFRVLYATFRTGVDSVDSNLMKLTNQQMVFTGKLGISYVNTKSHPPQKFDVEGTMATENFTTPVVVKGQGTLVHTTSSGGNIACILSLSMPLSLSALNIRKSFYNTNDIVRMDILQSVLKKE